MSMTEIATGMATKETTNGLIDKLEAAAKNPNNEAKLVEVLSKVDKSGAMDAFRNKWDMLPKPVQWAVLRGSKGPIPISDGPLHTFIKFGFITYKGHQNEDGTVNDKEIQKMGGLEKVFFKYGIKVGALFIPELKPLVPFVDPLMKLDSVKGDLMTRVRGKLKDLRSEVAVDESKATEKEPNHIAKTAHDKLQLASTTAPAKAPTEEKPKPATVTTLAKAPTPAIEKNNNKAA